MHAIARCSQSLLTENMLFSLCLSRRRAASYFFLSSWGRKKEIEALCREHNENVKQEVIPINPFNAKVTPLSQIK